MKREEFCEVLGDINENYVKEAGANPKAERRRRFKWKVIAACLCLLLAAPLTVFAMDTIQYHAAVDYLRSLGIPVEDLSDYSRTEIKEAVKTMDAGESSLLTEEILNLLPDSGEPIQRPTQVTSEQVRELTPTMTREEVLSFLGDTQDIGSGIYIYIYKVDGEALLRIPFASDEAQLGVRSKENGKRKKMTVITMTEEKNTDQSMAERRKIKIKKIKIKKSSRRESRLREPSSDIPKVSAS